MSLLDVRCLGVWGICWRHASFWRAQFNIVWGFDNWLPVNQAESCCCHCSVMELWPPRDGSLCCGKLDVGSECDWIEEYLRIYHMSVVRLNFWIILIWSNVMSVLVKSVDPIVRVVFLWKKMYNSNYIPFQRTISPREIESEPRTP